MAIGLNTDTAFIISKHGSPLSQLTSGTGGGKIKFMVHADATAHASNGDDPIHAGLINGGAVTGIVFPLHGDTLATFAGSELTHSPLNIIGDPTEERYSLTSGDLFDTDGNEVNGGAQKFVNAVLDGAYRAYTSGVAQSSGLSSMTVTRGDLGLSNTTISDSTGIVNTYTRAYTVNFKYYQSGTINSSGSLDPANAEVADDNSDGVPF